MKKSSQAFPEFVLLLILDGWGVYRDYEGNAITRARTPNWDRLVAEYPAATLKAGEGCEGGHYSLGAGFSSASSTRAAAGPKGLLLVAESEKYALLADYFNQASGGITFKTEPRLIAVPGTQDYRRVMEASAKEATNSIIKSIEAKDHDLIVANYAQADILARKGDLDALSKAIELIDEILGRLSREVIDQKGFLVITADHGNAEYMIDEKTRNTRTGPTKNPVPLVMAGQGYAGLNLGWPDTAENDLSTIKPIGRLEDLGPLVMGLFELRKPEGKRA